MTTRQDQPVRELPQESEPDLGRPAAFPAGTSVANPRRIRLSRPVGQATATRP